MGSAAGLFTGDSGVALCLAVTGALFENPAYTAAARSRFESACNQRAETDLFSGMAGVIWTACLLHEIVVESWPLDLGAKPAEALRNLADEVDGIPVWSADVSRETHHLGCAHGSAGIAMALGCWGRLTGDSALVERSLLTFKRLFSQGRVARGDALKVAVGSQRFHSAANWCHGVGGYLWALLQLFGDHESLRDEIDWAVGVLRESTAAATATYCHGSAGQLDLWRMLGGIPRHAAEAGDRCGKVVRALRLLHHKDDGHCVWRSDDPAVTTPDLWVGYLGPATALALRAAGSPHALLSAEWLNRCARGTPH